ncbi:diguanylate cyclase [Massilia sp. W12]|uniref:GGDEF domain-containing response regulator n=1 Tax=Massilia sp. W12 TaxID=3126507 RepID=UPI0030D4C4C3
MTDTPLSMEQALAVKLRQLEARFLTGLSDRLAQIESGLMQMDAAQHSGEPLAGALAELHRVLHTLAGTAGTFGFAVLGEHAAVLELAIKALQESAAPLPAEINQLRANLQQFMAQVRSDPHQMGVSPDAEAAPAAALTVPDSATVDSSAGPAPPATQASDVDCPAQDDVATQNPLAPSRLILLWRQHASPAHQEIINHLELFGYQVEFCDSEQTCSAAIQARRPQCLILDTDGNAQAIAVAQALGRIKKNLQINIPSLFIAAESDFSARLAAARAGIESYFSKPADLTALSEKLDELCELGPRQPCRILVIDDDPVCAEYHEQLLAQAGMHVRLLSDPSGLLQEMMEFRPELVLMDMYMPHCTGLELARILRQDNVYLDVPIVYLSTERDELRQRDALAIGGDEFLCKPIDGAQLTSAICSRVSRYRKLRELILRDSLTGLYKHSSIKDMLDREVQRARRNTTPLSVAMLDIDHFKQINDSWGHPVGDHVLRTLARLMWQHLRRVDILGRYGGEEFLLIMPDTSVEAARMVVDSVREVFAKIRHHAQDSDFQVTFSAGVADLRASDNAATLIQAADEAMYQAKKQGRNRVCPRP